VNAFDFTVIMAVYNVEPYLREALESLRRQTLGFERIQVSLVDDGSTDGSGKICDEWAARFPANVKAIHQANGGVSAARNNGLPLAEGKYINFMDADDLMMENTFERVHAFLREHGGETDAVSVPIYDFGASEGENWHNLKFKNGDRVIDLEKEYQIRQSAVNSVFIEKSAAQAVRFDPDMPFAEDFKYMIQILRRKNRLGVVSGCGYRYRVRGTGTSATEKCHQQKSWYTTIFDRLYFPAMGLDQDAGGLPPKWIQFGILWDMRCRVHEEYAREMDQILNPEERKEYLERIHQVLSWVDDQVFREAPEEILEPVYKAWLVRQKHPDRKMELIREGEEISARIGEIHIARAGQSLLEIFGVSDAETGIRLSGVLRLLPMFRPEKIRIMAEGKPAAGAAPVPCPVRRSVRFREILEDAWSFEAEVPLQAGRVTDLFFELELEGGESCAIRGILPGRFQPVSGECSDLAVTGKWKYIMTADFLRMVPYGTVRDRLVRTYSICRAMIRHRAWGALWTRLSAGAVRRLIRKPVWLISDRINKADDNGEAFFRYLRNEHRKDIHPCFVLAGSSADCSRMKKLGTVLPAGGFRHRIAALISEVQLSSSDRETFQPFGKDEKWYIDLLSRVPYVFLQHGITRGNLSGWLNRWNQNFAGLTAAAHPEYRSFLEGDYGYTEREIWLTGFARFDRLENRREKIVTIMPTWRKHLVGKSLNPQTGQRELLPGFEQSRYYQFFHALLNHPLLLEASRSMGYRIQFFIHPQMAIYAQRFGAAPEVVILPLETSYRKVYAESSLVITDYSSAVYDFAYLRKPVIYAQFDREELKHGGHIYTEGNAGEQTEELGIVTENVEDTVREIVRYMKTGCEMEPEYRERVNRFFLYFDRNNNARIYERIQEILHSQY